MVKLVNHSRTAAEDRGCCQARIQEFLVEGDDMDDEKIGRGLGAAVGPQRGPGAEPLVGVKEAKPPIKVTFFHKLYSDFALSI
jgi:hypothetical protein